MTKGTRLKAAAVAAAALASLAVAAVPAEASECKAGGGALYICEYGVLDHVLPDGQKEQFLVGTDQAVWTRWTTDGRWSGWQSLGGIAKSGIYLRDYLSGPDTWSNELTVLGSDGKYWSRHRHGDLPGAPWSAWAPRAR